MASEAVEGEVVGVSEVAAKKPEPDSIEYFEQAISLQWNKAVESIIEVGRLLHEAENKLCGLQMNKLCNQLGMKTRTRQRLIQIANYEPFKDASILTHLPSSYSTLATIAQLSEAEFETALKNDVISTESTGGAIISYIKQLKASPSPNVAPPQPKANFEFVSVYIDRDSITAEQLNELHDLKVKIDAISNVRSETTTRGKKYLHDAYGNDALASEKRDLKQTRNMLIEKAEQKANKEGKTFFAVVGYEKSTIYDFHHAAAVKALGGDLELFGIHETIAQMEPYEINEHMGDAR